MLERCSSSSSCWPPLPSPKNDRTSPTSDVRASVPLKVIWWRRWVSSTSVPRSSRSTVRGVAQVERQRPAVDVVALERRVGERGDLGDERVGPHEPGQRVAELEPLLVVERLEPGLAGPERGVGRGGPLLRPRRRRRAAPASPPRSPRRAARRSRRAAGGCPRGCSGRSAGRRCSRGTARTPRRCPRSRCGSRARTCSPSAGGCGSAATASAPRPGRRASCRRTSCAAAAGRSRSGTSRRRSAPRSRSPANSSAVRDFGEAVHRRPRSAACRCRRRSCRRTRRAS